MAKSATALAKEEICNAATDAVRVIAQAANEATKVISAATAEASKVSSQKTVRENQMGTVASFIYKQLSLGLSIMGVVIAGFIYLTDPAQDNDTALQLQEQRITAQREVIDGLTKTQQNDTQEVKKAIENTNLQMQIQSTAITKLSTIIEERIPAKK
jgi:hypothetical protein